MASFRVLIGIPSMHVWEADFGMCLTQMGLRLMRYRVADYSSGTAVFVINKKGSMLPTMRHELVMDARKHDCTHLLFVDSDQTFPEETIHRLASHHELIVGANVATKVLPPHTAPTARKKSVTPGFELLGDVVYTMENSSGLERVWRLGFGLMLIDMQVFDRIPMPHLFDMKWSDDGLQYVGEDWHFSQACEARDIPIMVDHDLSKKIGHVGACEYTHDMILPHMVEELRKGIQRAA